MSINFHRKVQPSTTLRSQPYRGAVLTQATEQQLGGSARSIAESVNNVDGRYGATRLTLKS